MTLISLINRNIPAQPWQAGEKIPWNDPAFSKRMLKNHLSQEHDWASRRGEIIERQVKWLVNGMKPESRVLDLGCGPGLYLQRLAALGHRCTGIDFSPASIEYARLQAAEQKLPITYIEADIRNFSVAESYDLILLTFGEINVFSKADAKAIITHATGLLADGGRLVIEVHDFAEVQRQGQLPASWQTFTDDGLFSPDPHLLLQESFWDEEQKIATSRYWIIDSTTGDTGCFGASMQAYTTEDYAELFSAAGLIRSTSLADEEWPHGDAFTGKLKTYVCRK
jgi:2-polyprenyl-3-methyl-5-hydroxy-6-metoxy-1,4-benzoquinol methylase